jgi:hypothetical protein
MGESSSEQTTELDDDSEAVSSGIEESLMLNESEMREEPRRYLCYQGIPVSDELNSSPINDSEQKCSLDSDSISLTKPKYELTDFLLLMLLIMSI